MKKSGILNSSVAKVAADLGHTDKICVSDLGLPTPNGISKIDISLDYGIPSLIDTLKMLNNSLVFEKVYIAKETLSQNKKLYKELELLYKNIKIEFVTHEQLKEMTNNCKTIIRTGENTPYANIILQSKVNFERIV